LDITFCSQEFQIVWTSSRNGLIVLDMRTDRFGLVSKLFIFIFAHKNREVTIMVHVKSADSDAGGLFIAAVDSRVLTFCCLRIPILNDHPLLCPMGSSH
jgi:hypothetical protein